MKVAAIAFAALSFAVAGSAGAAEHVTDMDYLKANRCKGLAAGLGGAANTAGLDAFIKAEGRNRNVVIQQRGEEEFARAKREAAKSDSKDRLSAELAGPCTAYMAAAKDMAAR